eukprot:6857152-Pyramimonas_sp.AAC.1
MSESLKPSGTGKLFIISIVTSRRSCAGEGMRFQAVHGTPSGPGAELLSLRMRFCMLPSVGMSIWEQSRE